MKILRKTSLKISMLLLTILSLLSPSLTVAKAATNENPKEIYNEISLDELEIGVPFVTYQNLETGTKVEIELESKEETPYETTTYGAGNSGWSGGSIPSYTKMTLTVRTKNAGIAVENLEYKVDVNGATKTIMSAYGLSYSLLGYTMQSTSLNVSNPTATPSSYARSEMNYTAILTQYGFVINSYGGYLNLEINYQGQVRTSWFV